MGCVENYHVEAVAYLDMCYQLIPINDHENDWTIVWKKLQIVLRSCHEIRNSFF